MRLGVRMLNNTSTLNNLMYVNQVQINPGETYTVMFQIVDLDQRPSASSLPQRYIPITGSTMSITLTSIDQSRNISKIPSNPFVDDRSIWSFNLTAADTAIAAGVNMTATLTEGANIRIARSEATIIIGPQSTFSC